MAEEEGARPGGLAEAAQQGHGATGRSGRPQAVAVVVVVAAAAAVR